MKNRLWKNKITYVIIAVLLLVSLSFTACSYGLYDFITDNISAIDETSRDDEGNVVEMEVSGDSEETESVEIQVSEAVEDSNENPEDESQNEGTASEEPAADDNINKMTEDGKIIVDLIFFMGQSNMAGAGGNVDYAPKVLEEAGYEFRAVSDPTKLYPITEPFGINENNLNAIYDVPGAKRGSLVSAFTNKYYELTGIPIVAVSASAGATDTDFWMSAPVAADYTERMKRAIVWLEASGYSIRHKYVIWLQGESDAIDNISSEEYETNMDVIIRPMYIDGLEKVFYITPGRTVTRKDYFENIISAQIKMSKESGYYALGTTVLSGVSTEYMVDEWHYNQKVLNLVGEECAKSVAYYTNNGKECCLYDYRHNETFVPSGDGVEASEVTPIDFSKIDLKIE